VNVKVWLALVTSKMTGELELVLKPGPPELAVTEHVPALAKWSIPDASAQQTAALLVL
jgi:hypothetical protein